MKKHTRSIITSQLETKLRKRREVEETEVERGKRGARREGGTKKNNGKRSDARLCTVKVV